MRKYIQSTCVYESNWPLPQAPTQPPHFCSRPTPSLHCAIGLFSHPDISPLADSPIPSLPRWFSLINPAGHLQIHLLLRGRGRPLTARLGLGYTCTLGSRRTHTRWVPRDSLLDSTSTPAPVLPLHSAILHSKHLAFIGSSQSLRPRGLAL